jgi:hypothetical protein
MPDFKTLREMLARAGIAYAEDNRDGLPVLTVVGGYMGFYTEFKFTPTGQLKTIEAYE